MEQQQSQQNSIIVYDLHSIENNEYKGPAFDCDPLALEWHSKHGRNWIHRYGTKCIIVSRIVSFNETN